jgi:NAD(P)-dependent dehydrogenase (short-subunit alcohol dehydrogenase family)
MFRQRYAIPVDVPIASLTAWKHAVIGILRAASLDLYENFGICLNSVAPGPVVTNLGNSFAPRNSPEKVVDEKEEGPYVFENQDPIQPAIAAAHLLSHDVHGKSILVFGGRFREIEGVYESFRENMFGGALGMPPVSDKGWRNIFACSF